MYPLRSTFFGLALLLSFFFAAVLATSASAQLYLSDSFGASAQFASPPVSFGPAPQASGSTLVSDPYGDADSSSSLNVLIPSSGSNQGKILNLSTGALEVNASGASGSGPFASADSTVHNLNMSLLSGLLTLKAKSMGSSAIIEGECGSLTYDLDTTIENFEIKGTLGSLFQFLIGAFVGSPAPNTSAGAFGITVIINEQNVVQDGDSLSIEVNALHVVVDNFLLRRLGIIDGEIIVGHSQAAVACGVVEDD